MTELPEGPSIIATGPLTSDEFAESLKKLVGKDFLYFYDAVAPIVTLESVDPNYSFRGNRYGEMGLHKLPNGRRCLPRLLGGAGKRRDCSKA